MRCLIYFSIGLNNFNFRKTIVIYKKRGKTLTIFKSEIIFKFS